MTSLANLKIGFIGGGNMASALIGGLIKQGAQAKNNSLSLTHLIKRVSALKEISLSSALLQLIS